MSNEDLQATLAALEKFRVEIASDPDKLRQFFVQHGFVTPEGELTEHYK